MTTDVEIAWLAGFVDGEGTFALSVQNKPAIIIGPRFHVGNTNVEGIRKAKEVITSIVGREVRYVPRGPQDRRPFYHIDIRRRSELLLLCEALLPHLVVKKTHAELMLQYLAIMPDALGTSRHGNRDGLTGYTDEHWALVDRFKELNKTYGPGEWQLPKARDLVDGPRIAG